MRIRAGLLWAMALLGACTATVSDPSETTSDSGTTATSVTSESSVTTGGSDPTTSISEPSTDTTAGASAVEVGAVVSGEGTLSATVVQILPHDFSAQTQGLAWSGSSLVESVGAYGSSERRFLSPVSAQTSQEKFLAPELFSTDVTVVGDLGIQLSGREGIATTFDPSNLNEVAQVRYEGQGWGICLEGDTVVMSDNSETLLRRNPQTLAIVSPQPSPENLTNLRALECVERWIWAVVGDTNTLAVINIESGALDGSLDVTELLPDTAGPNDALSAIAFNPETETFFLAGRRWGVVYEVTIESPAG